MRHKLEVPLTARLVNNHFFRRFSTTASAGGSQEGMSETGTVYGAMLNRDVRYNRREAQR